MGATCSCLTGGKEEDDGGRPDANDVKADPSGTGDRADGANSLDFGYPTNFAEHYKLGKEIGRGQYGTTYRCTSRATGAQYAAKRILKKNLTDWQAIEDVKKEVQILRVLRGKRNIVEFYGAFESDKEITMVLECCRGGELFQKLLDNGRYSERDAATVMRQILQVVADCHVNGVIHRDLKPENFLYVSDEPDALLKLIDFGLSDFFELNSGQYFTDVAGSAYYVAPEVLRRKYSASADLWSCGVIMYILLTGEVPFWAPTEPGIFKQILKGRIDLNKGSWRSISKDAKILLLSMLTRDPEARISAAKALAHPWICQDGIAPATPLDIKIVHNMKRFAGYNRVKQAILVEVAKTFDEGDMRHLQQQFSRMDTNNSGSITIQELVDGLANLRTGKDGRPVYDQEEIEKLIRSLDVDGDGALEWVEFVAAAMSTYQMSRGQLPGHSRSWQDRVRVVFDRIDEDGNGLISAAELSRLLGESDEVAALIRSADKDGDGLIDYDEFQQMLWDNAKEGKPSRTRTAKARSAHGSTDAPAVDAAGVSQVTEKRVDGEDNAA